MTEDTKYNGWTNYETWNAKLWLDNDEGSYNYCQELAQEAYDNAEADDDFSKAEKAAFALAESLKELFESDERIPDSGWLADAVNSYLGAVNWDEIANAYIEDDVDQNADAE